MIVSPKLVVLMLFALMVACSALTGCADYAFEADRHACAIGKASGARCISYERGGTQS
jgi:hypothetical protein